MRGSSPSVPSHIPNITKTQILIIPWKSIRGQSPSPHVKWPQNSHWSDQGTVITVLITPVNYLMKICVVCQSSLKKVKKDGQLQRKPLENACHCGQPWQKELEPWSWQKPGWRSGKNSLTCSVANAVTRGRHLPKSCCYQSKVWNAHVPKFQRLMELLQRTTDLRKHWKLWSFQTD